MLRQCRVAMVQTPSQYDFVHQAVVRFGKVNNKTIKVRDPDLPDGDTFSPSLDEVPEGETAVAIEPVKGLKYLDVGKRCTVRKYEGKEGCLMWMGKDPRKNSARCGIVFDEPCGNNDGSLVEEGTGVVFRFFKCDAKHGVMTSPSNVAMIASSTPGMTPASTPEPQAGPAGETFAEMYDKQLQLEAALEDDASITKRLALSADDMAQYGVLWTTANTAGGPTVDDVSAVRFFRKSGLPVSVLRGVRTHHAPRTTHHAARATSSCVCACVCACVCVCVCVCVSAGFGLVQSRARTGT